LVKSISTKEHNLPRIPAAPITICPSAVRLGKGFVMERHLADRLRGAVAMAERIGRSTSCEPKIAGDGRFHLRMNRRSFLRNSTALAAGAFFPHRSLGAEAKVIDTKVISLDDGNYHGWPTLIRRKNGQLMVACSGGREHHVCPFGRVDLYVSNDDGATWGWPRTVLDGDSDDRDAGILETAKGSLLITTFTSLAYEPSLKRGIQEGKWDAARLARWKAAHERMSADERKAELGQWIIRSTDGGRTWAPRVSSIVNSPHGPVQLSDGRLLYVGKELWTGQRRNGISESRDDGQTWTWLTEIPTRLGDKAAEYHELHMVECKSGKLLVHIRNHNKTNADETLQTESTDGGKTWSEPHPIGVWGLPSHLLRLSDGRILMSYGYRRAPLGNQARISADEGATWSEPLMISTDGASGDLGYPSTAELGDGTLLTVWYEAMKGNPHAVLRQARWRLL
jgi:sialidase-1